MFVGGASDSHVVIYPSAVLIKNPWALSITVLVSVLWVMVLSSEAQWDSSSFWFLTAPRLWVQSWPLGFFMVPQVPSQQIIINLTVIISDWAREYHLYSWQDLLSDDEHMQIYYTMRNRRPYGSYVSLILPAQNKTRQHTANTSQLIDYIWSSFSAELLL